MIRHFAGYTKSQISFLLNMGYRHVYDLKNYCSDIVTNEENIVFSDKHKRLYFGSALNAYNVLLGELNDGYFEFDRTPVHFERMLNRKILPSEQPSFDQISS